jgi:hypothetical protein
MSWMSLSQNLATIWTLSKFCGGATDFKSRSFARACPFPPVRALSVALYGCDLLFEHSFLVAIEVDGFAFAAIGESMFCAIIKQDKGFRIRPFGIRQSRRGWLVRIVLTTTCE